MSNDATDMRPVAGAGLGTPPPAEPGAGAPGPSAKGAQQGPPRDDQAQDYRQMRFLSRPILLEEVGPPGSLRRLIAILSAAVFGFIVWAAVTPIAETARVTGEVVPGTSVTKIQHLEGGIVAGILVKEGDFVEKGKVLVMLDAKAAISELGEIQAAQVGLELRSERLRAFAEGRAPDFAEKGRGHPKLVAVEREIHRQQLAALGAEARVIRDQIAQKRQDIRALERKAEALATRERILGELRDMRRMLQQRGLVSRVVYLNTLDQYRAVKGEWEETQVRIAQAAGAVAEAESRLFQLTQQRRNEALEEAGKVEAELATVYERMIKLEDRVARLDVRAPVAGIVKGMAVRALGAVLPPGGPVTDIVPTDSEMRVEARIDPADVGHIHVGQAAKVRITAFDFSRYGMVDGTVSRISATTFLDERAQPYYRAEIRLARNYVGDDPEANRILPGMTTEANITTGERTILRYLLRPVYQSLDRAMTER